ncbi:atrophin-1 [Drosophila tropicalis]|uniref:atrophin-1 n=1 Tax=Drosophila tropicalis TaxID=46794 RepID=UPI0035ABF0B1
MFCSESCEHGLNATSAGKILGPSQPNQTGAEKPTQAQTQTQVQEPQPQIHMCCPPLPGPGAVGMEPPRVGMCFVTEGPEGLSIDCNVPLPNSFNLEEFKKQMSCCCCPPLQQGNHYFDGFCNMPLPLSQQQPQPLAGSASQMPSCGCQCCQCACPCLPCYEQPIASPGGSHSPRSPSKSSKQERCVELQPQVPSMMPPFFCVAVPANTQTPQMDCPCLVGPMHMENGATFLCTMIPATQQQLQQPMPPPHSCHYQTIGVMPLQSPPHLHLQQQQQQRQQQQQQEQQESQQPLSPQLLRFDFPLPCQLTDFRQDKDKSCCEPMPSALTSSSPLSFQVYAPMGPTSTASPKAIPTGQPRPPPSNPTNASPETEPSFTGAPAANTTLPSPVTMGKRSCLRNKPDSWIANGQHQIQNSCASPGNNVCMKCGNCWHCPCCSNCHWHPSLLRQNVDKRR